MLQERRSKLVESVRMNNVDMVSTVAPTLMEPLSAGKVGAAKVGAAKCEAAKCGAPKAGAELRNARERLGVLLQDVALGLRIRLPHLEAIEAGRMSELPSNAHALAFVRTYAAALGLDASEMVRRFKTEAAGASQLTNLVFPVPMPERGVPPGAVLLLGMVLAVGAYAGWYRLSGEGRLPAETVSAIPERLASLAEQALPPVAKPMFEMAANVAPRPAPVEPAMPTDPNAMAEPADPAPPVMAIYPGSAAAAQLPHHVLPDAGEVPAADASRILLRATADAWLLVKDRNGATLLNRTLKPGDTWPVPARADLLLTTGNAGGTEVVVDGVAAPSLGGNGAVRRDLPLDADLIRDGKLASAAVPQVAAMRARQ